eukprot:COSAG06_NODE_70653_length_191_cov_15.554348_2_plen_43_part_01
MVSAVQVRLGQEVRGNKKIQKEIKRYSTIYIVGGSTLIYPGPH